VERKSVVYGEENRCEVMKTFLRNCRTGVYFQGVSNWTNDLREAFDFKAPERAVRFVRDAGLKRVELVLAFEDPRYNIQLPVDERFGASSWSGAKRAEGRQAVRAGT
jgi:hypothetical protein